MEKKIGGSNLWLSHSGTPFHHNYHKDGLEKGYFVRHGEGGRGVWTGYSNSTLLDISNPQAYQWVVDMIAEVSPLLGGLSGLPECP